MSLRGTVGSFKEILKNRDELMIEWQIPNFLSLSVRKNDWYESKRFFFCNTYWQLCLLPCDYGDQTLEGKVSLSLVRVDAGSPRKIIAPSIQIKGWNDKKVKKGIVFEHDGREAYEWSDFCSRSDLKKQRHRLMPSDILTFICKLKVNAINPSKGVLSHQDVSVQTDSKSSEPNTHTVGSHPSNMQDASCQTQDEIEEVHSEENKSSRKQGTIYDIGKDIGKLLVSGECSDTVVQVCNSEFRVHRAILSVRSPVLHAAFQHDTAESATNRISINDCDPDVFQEYLHYVYTGSTQSLTSENVFNLYQVADKYLAEDLKMRCLEHIQDTICMETFCSALQLALTQGEDGLLKLAIYFASKNIKSILCSVEWQNFICKYPIEANEILIKCYDSQT